MTNIIYLGNDHYINMDHVREVQPVPVSDYTGAKPGTLRLDFVGSSGDDSYIWVEDNEAAIMLEWLRRHSA